MEEYCVENNVELLHIRQILKSEAYLKAFQCVFNFDEDKPDFTWFLAWKRYGVKILPDWSRPWLAKKVDRNWLVSPPLKQRSTEQRSTELNTCLHNVRSIRNKTKDVNALLEVNEISLRVFIESWITNNSDDDFILKQYCTPGFLFYSAPRVNKRGGGICLSYRNDIHSENFEKITSEFFECCYASLTVGATSYFNNRCLSTTWIKC